MPSGMLVGHSGLPDISLDKGGLEQRALHWLFFRSWRSGRHSPGSSLTQQVVSKLSTALLKAEVPLVQEKWAT